jgi:hypothetical protein
MRSRNGERERLNQYLSNPQLLNAYSYGLNNPLKYRDEKGKNPLLVAVAVGAGVGAAGGLLGQYIADVHQNIGEGRSLLSLGTYSPQSSRGAYGASALTGTFSGAAAVFGIPGLIVGGIVEAGGSILRDAKDGKDINYVGAALNGIGFVGIPFGVNRVFGKVVGREVSTLSAYMFSGAHTQREATIAALQATITALMGTLQQLTGAGQTPSGPPALMSIPHPH